MNHNQNSNRDFLSSSKWTKSNKSCAWSASEKISLFSKSNNVGTVALENHRTVNVNWKWQLIEMFEWYLLWKLVYLNEKSTDAAKNKYFENWWNISIPILELKKKIGSLMYIAF